MAWTHAGTLAGNSGGAPTHTNVTIGNLLILEVINFSNSTVWATSISGGGANWVAAGTKFSGTTNAESSAVFFGTVTATGSQTPSITWSGTAPASFGTCVDEFHSSVGSWVLDKQGNTDVTGSSNYPSVTPSFGAGELYFGYCTTNTAVAGSTSGYVYTINADTTQNGSAYNLSCPNTATFPVWGDSGIGLGTAVLVAESSAGSSINTALPGQTWLRQFRHPQVTQIATSDLTVIPIVQSNPGNTWIRQFKHPQIQQPQPTVVVSGVVANVSVSGQVDNNILITPTQIQPIFPGDTWTKYFLHPQHITPASDLLLSGPTANITVSGQADNSISISVPASNADIAVSGQSDNSVSIGGGLLNQAPALPGETWLKTFLHPQHITPASDLLLSGTTANITTNALVGFSLLNDFEEGTNGTGITTGNSGGTGENAFDTIFNGSGATFAYDSNNRAHGSLSGKAVTGGTVALDFLEWDTSIGANVTQLWFREYIYLTANPASAFGTVRFLTGASGAQIARLALKANGTIGFNDAANTQQIVTTSTIPVGQWFRVEGFVVSSATVGQLELQLFTGNCDSTIATEIQTSTATLNTNGAAIGAIGFGIVGTGVANQTIWIDDIGATNAGYLGPAASGLTNVGPITSAPGDTWLKQFRHPQVQQVTFAQNINIIGVVADIPVSAQSDNSLLVTISGVVSNIVVSGQADNSVFIGQQQNQAKPGKTWISAFRHPQLMQPQPTTVIPGFIADIPVVAIPGNVAIDAKTVQAIPGRTWLRYFQHPQSVFPTTPPVGGVLASNADISVVAQVGSISTGASVATANIVVSGQADNSIFIGQQQSPAYPGQTWRKQFQHSQVRQPQPTVVVSGTVANITVSGQADNSLLVTLTSTNADIAVSGQSNNSVSTQITLPFPPASLPGKTWLRRFKHPQTPQLAALVPVTLVNTFEGGTNGTTLTQGSGGNTGGGSGNFLDEIHISGTGTLAFDNTVSAHDHLSVKVASTTSSTASAYWTTSMGPQGRIWFREYLYFTANPTNSHRIWNATQDSIGGSCATLAVNTSGFITVQTSNAGTLRYTFTNAIPLNQWFRVEGSLVGDPINGAIEVRLFKTNADADITSYDEAFSISGINTTATPITYRFGLSTAVANVGPFWMDDLGLSNVTWLGPGSSNFITGISSVSVATNFGDRGVLIPMSGVVSDIPVAAPVGSITPGASASNADIAVLGVAGGLIVPITITGTVANISVVAPAGNAGTTVPALGIFQALPGPTWIEKFRHPQQAFPPFIPLTLLNNFEGGVNGATLSFGLAGNTGGVSGNYFDDISRGSGAVLAFDTTHSAHGIYSVKTSTGSTAAASIFRWSTQVGAPQSNVWSREYLYFTANPANNFRIQTFANVPGGVGVCATVSIDTTGHIFASAGNSSLRLFTFATGIPLNQWFRVETNVIGDPANGYVEVRLFSTTPDGNISSYDEVNSASGLNTNSGSMSIFSFGPTNAVANIGPYWTDDVGISNVTWLGPVTVDQSFGTTANVSVDSTFADENLTISASATANISVTAPVGTVIGTPPPVIYPALPGKAWIEQFKHTQTVQPPSPVLITGTSTNILVDASGQGAGVISLSANNADIAVTAIAGAFTIVYSALSNVVVNAELGSSSVSNLIQPAMPGDTWVRQFHHPQPIQQFFQIIGAQPAFISVNTIASTLTTLSGVTSTISVSAPTGTTVVSQSILSPIVVTANVGTPVNTFAGIVAPVIVVANAGTLVQSRTATSNISVVAQGSITESVSANNANVTVVGVAGLVSIPVNLHGIVANVVVASTASTRETVTGVTATITVTSVSGTVKESPPPLPAFIVVTSIPSTRVSVSGVTATISVSSTAGTISRNISGQISNIIVRAIPGLAGQLDIEGKMLINDWESLAMWKRIIEE